MLDFYHNKGRRAYYIIIITFILLVTLAFFAGRVYTLLYLPDTTSSLVIAAIPEERANKTIGGQVEYVEGIVEARSHAGAGWFSVKKGELFKKNNELRTLAASRAIVTFEDGSVMRLDENTHVIFIEDRDDISIDIERGEIFNNVTKSDMRAYRVHTAHYVVKALGTEFDVTETSDATSVLVLENAVEVHTASGDMIDRVEAGDKAKVVSDRIEKGVIANEDLADEFIAWSTTDDEAQKELTKKETQKNDDDMAGNNEKNVANGSIVLSGEKSSSGVRLHWDVKDMQAPHGFKIVKSTDAHPVYPGSDYQYLSDSSVRDYKWKIDTGNKYHFRVCVYDGSGACLLYSNDIYLDTPSGEKDDEDDYASSISLSAKEDDGDVKLTWDMSGGNAPLGFKIVKSKESNPVYPGDDYQYIADGDVRKYTWKGFSKGKTYHFRVCIYKGGVCGTYSNDVKVSF